MQMSMARSNVMNVHGINVSQYFRIVEVGWNPWSDFNADNNRRDLYCENTCLAAWPEVMFWPRVRDVWPLHFDSRLLSNRNLLKGELTLESRWLADLRLTLFVLGEIALSS